MKFNLRFTLVLSVFLFLLCPSLVFASSQSFSYDFSFPLHAPKGSGFRYDGQGNMLSSPNGPTLVYDQANRLIKVSDKDKVLQENTYDHTGARIKKIDYTALGTITTYYHLPGMEIEISNTNTQPLITITRYLPQGTIQKLTDQENKIYQTYTDHLGSTRLITDDHGNKIEDYDYYPYGTITQPLSPNTSQPTNRLYTSQIKDKTNLYYYNARYYDPSLGIFTSPDQAQGPNRYLYVGGNPVMRSDPSGNAYESGAGGGGNTPNYYHYTDPIVRYSPVPRAYLDYRAREAGYVLSKTNQGLGVGIEDFYGELNNQWIETTGVAFTTDEVVVAAGIFFGVGAALGPWALNQLQASSVVQNTGSAPSAVQTLAKTADEPLAGQEPGNVTADIETVNEWLKTWQGRAEIVLSQRRDMVNSLRNSSYPRDYEIARLLDIYQVDNIRKIPNAAYRAVLEYSLMLPEYKRIIAPIMARNVDNPAFLKALLNLSGSPLLKAFRDLHGL